MENYLGLNYYFPPETLWLATRRVSRPVRAAAAAPERLPPALEYYVRVRGKKEGGGGVVGFYLNVCRSAFRRSFAEGFDSVLQNKTKNMVVVVVILVYF